MLKFHYYDGGILKGYYFEDYGKEYFVDDIYIVPKDEIEYIEECEEED